MNELIAIGTHKIGAQDARCVSARDLHAFLLIGKDFTNWIKDQIQRARLVDGRDFVVFAQQGEQGKPRSEYALTMDAAKHVAMLSQTDRGFQVRDYFIDCERRASAPALALPNFSDPVAAARAWADATEQKQIAQQALALAAPKVAFVDRYVQANPSSMGVREVVKLLKTNGHTVNEHTFTAWLVDRGFMYRKKAATGKLGHLTPSAQHESAGRFDTKTGQGHGGINVPVHKFTGKGVEWIVGEWAKHQIRSEVTA